MTTELALEPQAEMGLEELVLVLAAPARADASLVTDPIAICGTADVDAPPLLTADGVGRCVAA